VISSLTRVGDVNDHIDELWPLAYRIGMIDKIPTFGGKKLSAIEENANRLLKVGNDKQRANAESVLAAIVAERQRRKDAATDRRKQHVAGVADKVRDTGLLDRVLVAFTEIPPEPWEAEVLKEIASNPNQDEALSLVRLVRRMWITSTSPLAGYAGRENYTSGLPLN
jgi:hypothetical protein